MRKYIVLLYSLLFLGIADCISQKKPLDMEAYKLWRRVEGQQMSEDGKWVTYRFVYIDQEGHDKDVPAKPDAQEVENYPDCPGRCGWLLCHRNYDVDRLRSSEFAADHA